MHLLNKLAEISYMLANWRLTTTMAFFAVFCFFLGSFGGFQLSEAFMECAYREPWRHKFLGNFLAAHSWSFYQLQVVLCQNDSLFHQLSQNMMAFFLGFTWIGHVLSKKFSQIPTNLEFKTQSRNVNFWPFSFYFKIMIWNHLICLLWSLIWYRL